MLISPDGSILHSFAKRKLEQMKRKTNIDQKLVKAITSAIVASIVCVATVIVRIPTPTNGYMNFGDCFVLLAGWVLGPLFGFLAGGIGSMLSDIVGGFPFYAPATFIIKGAMSLVAALIARSIIKKHQKNAFFAWTLSSVASEIIMVVGYFLFEAFVVGQGKAAIQGVPANLLQAAIGITGSLLITEILYHTSYFKNKLVPPYLKNTDELI